jgi:hypothetical protein
LLWWELLLGSTVRLRRLGLIDNGGFEKNQIVTIASSDKGFETSDCGTWTRID